MKKSSKFIIFSVLLLIIFSSFLFYATQVSQWPRQTNLKPRILFTNFHPQNSGGHMPFIKSIATSDLKNDFEFAVTAPETSDVYRLCKELGIKTYSCDFPGKFKEIPQILINGKNFRKIVKDYKPDIIHTNGGHDNTIAAWSTLFLKNRPRIVRTYHATKVIGKDPYHWLLYNRLINANMFVSSAAYQLNLDENGLKLENLYVIENGVDIQKFKPQNKDLALQEKLKIPDNYFIFGSNAGLSPYKRVDLMLEALTKFPKNLPFCVIALGHEPDPWIERAKEMGVDDYIQFVGYHKDVHPYCSLFDAGFILSDRVENSSFALREMLAMGIPVIASSFSGLKDSIKNNTDGIYVEPGNIEQIVSTMQFFLNLPKDQLDQFKLNARLKAESNFDQDQQLKSIAVLYSNIL